MERAYRRGCTVAAVAPPEPAGRSRSPRCAASPLPLRPGARRPTGPARRRTADPGALWALLTPLLALTDRIGLLTAPPYAIQALADRLDDAAERFGPAADTYRNPAKTLAAELAEALPLLWSEGPLTGPVARRFAALLTARAGRPALAAALPEAVNDHAALLAGTREASGDDDLSDFFRDRVDEPDTPRPRVVLLREPGDNAGHRAAGTARRAADEHGIPLSAVDAPAGSTTEALAELLALTDFVSLYLALATGEARTT